MNWASARRVRSPGEDRSDHGFAIMETVLAIIVTILVVGGLVVAMAGLVWVKVGRLLRLFEVNVNPNHGFKVVLIGFAITAFGIIVTLCAGCVGIVLHEG